ncbi:retrovirus-related Pol polyprotein from transposon 297 [Trichonephila clavipes]|nr:retrovirus-related Pol polyprotein from transposon 297 [Trichonephila clavipes]
MFQIFKDKGLLFQETTLVMSLADGQQTTGEALTTQVMVEIEGRSVLKKLIILPKAKGKRTLLGTDFLSSACLVLDVKNNCCHFWDNPTHKYSFGEELDTPSIVEKMSSNTCQLREWGGESLTSAHKEKLNLLLESFQNVFKPEGETTNILEHHVNTGNSPPISELPYRMSPVKKEILRKEIEDLLEKDIIEECEYPYGAPVVLIPKSNNQFRLCIDCRKLNEVTVPDTYPLPRMDDLLQEAKHTAYIFTIDLKCCYHQVNVNPADRDKTAFVCPFGTYRFKRMPFGLKNAPANFQRLMYIFRRGLPVLAYLDDIIIMSPIFEQHLADVEAVFKRLMDFKLRANREKYQFFCSRIKYLGLWITPQRIEVDHETSAILGIRPPKNVKQLQSFLQTFSWYRKCIANFSEIARPLSNLTKKKASWKWSEEEEKAFPTLKQFLVSPPILKQADFSQPFLIRADASNYALGAGHLQGEDKVNPLIPLRKRGRPPKVTQNPGSSSGHHRNQRGRM